MRIASTYDSLVDEAKLAIRAEFERRGLEPPLVDAEIAPSARKLVNVARYRDLTEAMVARTAVEASGIPVYLFDENVVRLNWQISNMIGGIRLQVEERDADEAKQILADQSPAEFDYDAKSTAFAQPTCPVCSSMDITFNGRSRSAALLGVFAFGVPLPLGRETWTCNACGARWENSEDI